MKLNDGRAAFAPAKVNLFLHVGGPDADGYHPVCSLMVFADVGDRVTVQPSDALAFEVTGPCSAGVPVDETNLVVRAANLLIARAGRPTAPFRLILEKNLPTAAGLGGGSSDAGATFQLLREALGLPMADETLEALASELGADGAVCLWAKPAIGKGRGEVLSTPPALPPLHAVLVNPGAPSPTGAVYKAYDAAVSPWGADRPPMPDAFESPEDVAGFLSLTRNDLEAPAVALTPVIGEVLALLRDEPEVLLARMSGSGATCFALCAGDIEAEGLADRILSMRPGWWVRACRLA